MSRMTENDWRGLFLDALMESDLTATTVQELQGTIDAFQDSEGLSLVVHGIECSNEVK